MYRALPFQENGLYCPDTRFDPDGSALRGEGEALARILALVKQRSGRDFSDYRKGLLERHVARRMSACGIGDVADYFRFLERDANELESLWHGWLIGVSAFFRDPLAFQTLFEKGLGPLIAEKSDGAPLRIWVAGCSTGEEAYSIAIGARELLDRHAKTLQVRILATDLSPAAVATARRGTYPSSIASQVSPERLERFFTREKDAYCVRAEIRRTIWFGNHDLLSDPAFRALDLITCRNLLIYLAREAQHAILLRFHAALNPGGLLFLGPSEGLRECGVLFEALDNKYRLFRKRKAS
jgi:two-component system, chemotaxis family, CheB/CheR fusion protein